MKHSKHSNIRECGASGKIYYPTEDTAYKSARNYEHKFHVAMSYYFCKHCRGYHLTKIKSGRNRHERIPD